MFARGLGMLRDEDVFGYQREVWSRRDVQGFDELMDMSGVVSIEMPPQERLRELAALSSGMDDPMEGASRFAIVAPDDLAFGLGQMYAARRDTHPTSRKRVEVFRTLAEAYAFLGITPGYDPWPEKRVKR